MTQVIPVQPTETTPGNFMWITEGWFEPGEYKIDHLLPDKRFNPVRPYLNRMNAEVHRITKAGVYVIGGSYAFRKRIQV